jgi:hypothetical protein
MAVRPISVNGTPHAAHRLQTQGAARKEAFPNQQERGIQETVEALQTFMQVYSVRSDQRSNIEALYSNLIKKIQRLLPAVLGTPIEITMALTSNPATAQLKSSYPNIFVALLSILPRTYAFNFENTIQNTVEQTLRDNNFLPLPAFKQVIEGFLALSKQPQQLLDFKSPIKERLTTHLQDILDQQSTRSGTLFRSQPATVRGLPKELSPDQKTASQTSLNTLLYWENTPREVSDLNAAIDGISSVEKGTRLDIDPEVEAALRTHHDKETVRVKLEGRVRLEGANQDHTTVGVISSSIETLKSIFSEFSKIATRAPKSGLNLIQALQIHPKYKMESDQITQVFKDNRDGSFTLKDYQQYSHDTNVLLLQAMLIIKSIESLASHPDQNCHIAMADNKDNPREFKITSDMRHVTSRPIIAGNQALAAIRELQRKFMAHPNFNNPSSIEVATELQDADDLAASAGPEQPATLRRPEVDAKPIAQRFLLSFTTPFLDQPQISSPSRTASPSSQRSVTPAVTLRRLAANSPPTLRLGSASEADADEEELLSPRASISSRRSTTLSQNIVRAMEALASIDALDAGSDSSETDRTTLQRDPDTKGSAKKVLMQPKDPDPNATRGKSSLRSQQDGVRVTRHRATFSEAVYVDRGSNSATPPTEKELTSLDLEKISLEREKAARERGFQQASQRAEQGKALGGQLDKEKLKEAKKLPRSFRPIDPTPSYTAPPSYTPPPASPHPDTPHQ